jgi:transposase InsO family protein
MPYTSNKHMPRVRRDAARLFFKGWSARKIGRYLGYHHTAVMKWVAKARKVGDVPIRTRSSRPHSHSKELPKSTVMKIIEKRRSHGRYAEVLYQELRNEGIDVSLSSIKRTLDRWGLLKKRSPYKRYHPHQDRPYPLKSGDLVQIDTIHLMVDEKKRIYIFVLIDVYSRWAYAKCYQRMSGKISLNFVREAQSHASFQFKMLQSDHGPEFGDWFVEQVKKNHRYTRIGKPNDNAHIERFNRTLQEECVDRLTRKPRVINCALKKYLRYYNYERLHTGINFLTPMQVVPRY